MESKDSTADGEFSVLIDLRASGHCSFQRQPLISPGIEQAKNSSIAVETQASPDQTSPVIKSNREKRRTLSEWMRKYFLEGQALTSTQTQALETLDPSAPYYQRLIVKHRRLMGVAIPFIFFQVIWWSCAIKYNFWSLFPGRYFMSITMVLGSLIAGMTSEGGGTVAFPIMTLAFSIAPEVARDFSLMIQSCGMTAAAFTILWMHVQLEWHSITLCSIGGIFGMIIGLEFIDPQLTPAQKKMGFVCVWFAFAFALFLLNRYHKRKTYTTIPEFKLWKLIVLLLTGLIGGIFSAIAGSGVDICSFSVLTLLFRVSEKTATPTSVVLMAGNTAVGFYWRQVIQQAVSAEAYYYLAVCVPIVVLGAPVGSVIGRHFHRQVLASFNYISDTVALISAFLIVPLSKALILASVCIIAFGFFFFGLIAYAGKRIMEGVENKRERQKQVSCEDDTYENTMQPSTAVNTVFEKDKVRRLETLEMAQGKSKTSEIQDVQKLDTLYEV
ncbi:uncharacterized protein LOC111338868 [Stylophora pistillata]|uniref:uncharacterized protein LOC111338868 n=1 Tax=Stylophora pistillata TaxID=50429 RepID=UPI000C05203F|nr:uncharacterized protein LOC111338868 [Stylophora pistillata]